MGYLPPIGYRVPRQAYSRFGYSSLRYLPALIGKLRALLPGPAVEGAPVITSPFNGQFEAQGVSFVVTAQVPAGSVPMLTFGSQAAVAMSVVGTTATRTVTPGAGDVGVATSLTVSIPTGSASIVLDVEANVAFWLDAQNPASYAPAYNPAAGVNLTSLKSLVTGTALATIVGNPQILKDPRDGKPGFNFPNVAGDCVKGADASYIAAVTGTDKAFCSVIVYEPQDVTANAAVDSVKSSATSGNGQEFLISASGYYLERDGAPTGPARLATSENVQAGCVVLVQHSSDGLNVKTSVNGEAETTAAFLTAGALSPNAVSVGIQIVGGGADIFPFYGFIKERIFFSADKTPTQIAAIVNAMKTKWRATRAPQVYFAGDSITTAQLATNGGMPTLISQAIQAAGGLLDAAGPLAVGQPYPYRHSAASGDTNSVINARISSNTLGLGLGGSSKGSYRRTKLTCLFAGTNGQNTADYSTMLTNIYARMLQAQASFKIAVTPITDIFGSSAAVIAYNAALVGIWDAFEAAHPGILIRWNAYLALPNDGSGTYYVDTTHPNNAGYVKMVNDPTYGLLQAIMPYIMSLQPA